MLKGEKNQIRLIVQYWDEIIRHYDCPWKGINLTVYQIIYNWAEQCCLSCNDDNFILN